jgi:hypothetical protein
MFAMTVAQLLFFRKKGWLGSPKPMAREEGKGAERV